MHLHFTGGIGDELQVSTILREWSRKHNAPICAHVSQAQELFEHNPYQQCDPAIETVQTLLPNKTPGVSSAQHLADQLNLGPLEHPTPSIYLQPSEIEGCWRDLLGKYEDQILVAFNVFGTFHSNTYPAGLWDVVVEQASARGYKTVQIGNHSYRNRKGDQPLLNVDIQLEGQTTLREVATVLWHCNAYIGVDTGLFHIAAAVETPQVVLFRADGSRLNGYPSTIAVENTEPCDSRCHDRCERPEPCISQIDPMRIVDAMEEAVNK